MMATGLATKRMIEERKYGKSKREPKQRKTSYRDYHIDFELTEDDLP